jgi:two-component system sensor histidine kinase/response regulator
VTDVENLAVLVVDDEPGMRLGVARALGGYTFTLTELGIEVGFKVDMAESGEQALEKIAAARPDILLLDHKLPAMSGLDVMEQLGATDDMLTVMITAYASLETAVAAIKKGAYDFLAKPFTPNELKNAVRKAAENLIMTRQARQLAVEKRQIRFRFISVLAHELKAPLGAIEGYLHILRNKSAGDDPAVYDHMLERCLVRSQHMRKMVMDLLDLTRIESGQKKRELVELDVRDLARTAMETAAPEALGQAVAISLHADAPVPMIADRGEIEIIFNNLLSNAVKYNRKGGRVDLTLRTEGDSCLVEVADTGIGMTEEEAARIFNEFVRVKNQKTRNILGSGLGLSIVKKLVLLYSGDITVASRPDEGTTFTLRLRRAPHTAAQAIGELQSHGP